MALNPAMFHHTPPFPYMTKVKWTQRSWNGGPREGEGVYCLHWLGFDEVWDVFVTGGITMHLHPELGDAMEAL